MTPNNFAKTLLTWFVQHGRKNLPWQQQITPYRVWVSEIMLQQTQVTTVIPYFQRFIKRFPTISSLANANEDEVLELWSGLGYYSRARNLHRSAKLVMQNHQGNLPEDLSTLQSLPGIGRSTAGAILAIASNQSTAILDGNVKRVLARYQAISGWPGQTAINQQLWHLAERYTPSTQTADYTQAIMDLGATICTRGRPACQHCPLAKSCLAHLMGQETAFPTPKPRKKIPVRRTQLILACDPQQRVLFVKRPPTGVWASLWSLPECSFDEEITAWCTRHGLQAHIIKTWPHFRHTFSHFHLDITPVLLQVTAQANSQIMEITHSIWCKIDQLPSGGIAAPIKRLLQQLPYTFCNTPGDIIPMIRMIECQKTKKTAEGLAQPPFPGELGNRIYEQISKAAWQQWLNHQTMLINEYRLNLLEPQAKAMLMSEMEKFLFGEGSIKPSGYVAPINKNNKT